MATMLPGAKTSTTWSKNDPPVMKRHKTDHWSKMKHKATTFTVKMPQATIITKPIFSGVGFGGWKVENLVAFISQEIPGNSHQFQVTHESSIVPLRCPVFKSRLDDSFGRDRPGSYEKLRSERRVSVPNMSQYRNPFNDRAREGFEFWPKARPKMTRYGKYGMGSYKSVLGLGDAVRT